MISTITFTSQKAGVEHDGKSMIVMNKDKETVAPASAEEFLREKGYIKGKVKTASAPVVSGGDGEVASLKAKVAEKEAELDGLRSGKQADSEFELEGFTFTTSGGGWYEITGGTLDEPLKEQGEDTAKGIFAQLVADKLNPPADGVGSTAADAPA